MQKKKRSKRPPNFLFVRVVDREGRRRFHPRGLSCLFFFPATTTTTTTMMMTSRRRRHLVVDDNDGKEDGKKNTPSKLSSNGGVLKKENVFFDRLIKDVSRVDFAAPAPAYLENDLGQSNVRRYLLEPGPKDGSHSRCRIVRKKDAFGYCTYVLYADCPSSVPSLPSSSMVEDDECGSDERKEKKQRQRRYHRFEARALCAARKRKKSRR